MKLLGFGSAPANVEWMGVQLNMKRRSLTKLVRLGTVLILFLLLFGLSSCIASRGYDITVYNQTSTGSLDVEIEGTEKTIEESDHKIWFLDREDSSRSTEIITVRYKPSMVDTWGAYSFQAELPACPESVVPVNCRMSYSVFIEDSGAYHD